MRVSITHTLCVVLSIDTVRLALGHPIEVALSEETANIGVAAGRDIARNNNSLVFPSSTLVLPISRRVKKPSSSVSDALSFTLSSLAPAQTTATASPNKGVLVEDNFVSSSESY